MQTGVTGLIILTICVFFFVTGWLPATVTGLIGCLLMVMLKACSFATAFSGFSSSIVLLMVSAMIVGIAMFKTGVAQAVGRKAIDFSNGNELRFLMASCVIGGLLSMFLANTALVSAFIPIIESICSTSNDMRRKNLLLPITMAIMIGGSATLVGCTPQLTANGLLQSMSGIEMTMWSLTGPAMCLFVVFLLYTAFFGYRQGKKIWGHEDEQEMESDRSKVDSVMNHKSVDRRKFICMCVILAFMITFYVINIIPVAYTAAISMIACFVTGCINVKDVRKSMNWGTAIFLAECLGLANAITESGAGDLIGAFVSKHLEGVTSPYFMFAIVVALTLVLSQFITNSTAIIIGLPLGLSLCKVYGYNPMAFCIGVTLAASIACCTPLAAAQITMTQVAGYKFKDYAKYCVPSSILMFFAILIFVPLFYPLV